MRNPIFDEVWWIIGLPLIGFLIQCFLGKRVIDRAGVKTGRRIMGTIAVLAIAGSFAIGVAITQALIALPPEARNEIRYLGDWINIFSIQIPFELRMDPLSMTMVLVITGIGSLIHLYATGYMAEEPDYPRFFAYLNLFVAFMLMLVMGNNLALLFIGWEGVGLCSYLLIGFWYKDFANSKAANKAFIVNRIGDVGLALGMFLIVYLLASNREALALNNSKFLSYDVIIPNLAIVFESNPGWATAIALCLFVGACGKSAQFPLYLWLPDAMAGPTPVSALIHAATMVTAGVVLLNRMQVAFINSPIASAVVVVVGIFTAIFAALIAFGRTDIKKVLAYSTVSQLGLMFVACGAGYYWVGMFHVITHAFFKALLFLGSGAVIHAMAHNQYMRNYGRLWKYIPITFATMFIGWIAIAGVPLTSGWFSKEDILHDALYSTQAEINGVNYGMLAGWFGFFAALLTAIYMTRMMMLTFWSGPERWKAIPAVAHAHDHHHEDHGQGHHGHADHGPDTHNFFYSDEEMAQRAAEGHDDHHHELDSTHRPHEVPPSMWIPLAVLAVFSLGAGLWLKGYKAFPTLPKDTLEKWLEPEAYTLSHMAEGGAKHHAHVPFEQFITPLGYWVGIIGIVIGTLWYLRGLPKSEGWDLAKWSPFRRAASNQFGYDQALMDASIEGGSVLGTFMWRFVDNRIVDGAVNGIAVVMGGFGKGFSWLQSGYARSYALMMLAGGAAILGWIIYTINTSGGRL